MPQQRRQARPRVAPQVLTESSRYSDFDDDGCPPFNTARWRANNNRVIMSCWAGFLLYIDCRCALMTPPRRTRLVFNDVGGYFYVQRLCSASHATATLLSLLVLALLCVLTSVLNELRFLPPNSSYSSSIPSWHGS